MICPGFVETEATAENSFEMPDQKHQGIEDKYYREHVDVPSQYFLQRGYSIEVLDKYGVGTCKRRGRPLYQRAVVPIYEDSLHWII